MLRAWQHESPIASNNECSSANHHRKEESGSKVRQGRVVGGPFRLFNSSLEGNTRRAIDIHEGDKIDEKALKALIRAAVAMNISLRANRA